MTMRALVYLSAIPLALIGCGGPKAAPEASASGSSGGGGGLLHEIQSEMGGPTKATRDGVALDVYFDVSDSATALKKPLGKLLEQVVDTYPEAVPYTYSFYGKEANLQDSGIANLQSIRRAEKAWANSAMRDKTTNLGEAFRRIRERANADPKTRFAAIIVTDGGFEDADGAKKELGKLRNLPNLKMLTFVGVHTGDNPKLQKLSDLTSGIQEGIGAIDVHLVTDGNNAAQVQGARDALRGMVEAGEKL